MPRIKSAKKALRQNLRRRATNLTKKAEMKDSIKQVKNLTVAKKKDEAREALTKAYQAIDKSAKSGIINKNASARYKSRLTKIVNKIK